MQMDLAGEKYQVEEGYEVRLPPGDHLVVIAGAHWGEPGCRFDHPGVVAKKSRVFEFKHYRRGGGKFWTSKAGIDFYFVIPKAQIELLPEKGYSYVSVSIRGRKCHLNVSGGAADGRWTDSVRRVAHAGCGWSLAALGLLGTVAVRTDECLARGITLEIEGLSDRQKAWFVETAAAVTMQTSLGPGSRLLMQSGWSYCGCQGPLEIESRPRRKRHFICKDGLSRVRVPYAAIDWVKTAQINGVTLPEPVLVNDIGPVLAPTSV
jgi:hypothetical protein